MPEGIQTSMEKGKRAPSNGVSELGRGSIFLR